MTKTADRPKPVILAILDGWGEAPAGEDNAIARAKKPAWDYVTRHYPHGLVNASELHVGLPEGQMGNSEVGHMNIGSGRVLMQDLPRIDAAIKDGSLARHPKLLAFIESLRKSNGACHLMGLLSPGGVHSHQHHVATLATLLAKSGIKVWIHAFLDGRDTPPQSALEYLSAFKKSLSSLATNHSPLISFATISGRYYAMDRDKRWDRVQKAYDAIASAKGDHANDPESAIRASYAKELFDEFVLPCTIGDYPGISDGDGVLMANFRADRVREILAALLDPNFKDFPRARTAKFAAALGMCEYSTQLNAFLSAMFPPEPLTQILGEIVSDAGLKQLRIAETEKYAHVTFFFNGGREKEFPGEERILVPSPKVATYDLKPEMSAHEVCDRLLAVIDDFDLIVVNFANTDMVGHTGDIAAATRAVEAVDQCLARIVEAVEKRKGAMIITADHGNAEKMHDDETKQAHTAHTLNLVPCIIIAPQLRGKHATLREGKLADIAPTILDLMRLKKPDDMTGTSLISSL